MQTGNTNYIYMNDLDKASFQHDMAYGKYIKSILNLCQINSLQMNFINQLLENFKKERFIHHLKTIFGVLI